MLAKGIANTLWPFQWFYTASKFQGLGGSKSIEHEGMER